MIPKIGQRWSRYKQIVGEVVEINKRVILKILKTTPMDRYHFNPDVLFTSLELKPYSSSCGNWEFMPNQDASKDLIK